MAAAGKRPSVILAGADPRSSSSDMAVEDEGPMSSSTTDTRKSSATAFRMPEAGHADSESDDGENFDIADRLKGRFKLNLDAVVTASQAARVWKSQTFAESEEAYQNPEFDDKDLEGIDLDAMYNDV